MSRKIKADARKIPLCFRVNAEEKRALDEEAMRSAVEFRKTTGTETDITVADVIRTALRSYFAKRGITWG